VRRPALFSLLAVSLAAQPVDYEREVRPVLRNCLGCHNESMVSGGLSLERQASILRGGNRGANPALILDAVKQTGELKMPPGKKLTPDQVAILERWVNAGLPMPEHLKAAKRRESKHWAFQPLRQPQPAETIDGFIRAKLTEAKLTLSPEANRRTLLRRVHLDLTGIPPTPAELEAFLNDAQPGAYERVVDRLLASPHYGERWGRRWLDAARYADTDGYTIDSPRDIWPYRDWVIQAINADQPFDQFVIEQVAGDLLPNTTREQIIATGFHRNTPSNEEGGIDIEQYRVEAVADRVATTGSAFLGLTLGCARCHDHKYDPVTQREFYQIFAFWNGVDEMDKEEDRKQFNKPFLELGDPEAIRKHAEWKESLDALQVKINKYEESLAEKAPTDSKLMEMRRELSILRRARPKLVRTMIMKERPEPRPSYIHLGGDFTRKGSAVEPGGLAVLPPMKTTGGKATRLDFARWLVDPANPLTPRVTVNRIWQEYFGAGIVPTENDFGVMGAPPSHPELLDFLAARFLESGWSQKALHRLIVTSAVYKQASTMRADAAAIDPENRLLARQNRLRLDAEIVRDASLAAAGSFTAKIGGPSVYPPIPAGAMAVTQVKREWPTATNEDRYRRGMYTFFQRSAGHPGLIVFDAPDASVSCTRRVRSNTPLQALTLLNDEAQVELAGKLAARILQEAPPEDAARLKYGFALTVQREPRPREADRLLSFLGRGTEPGAAWVNIARILLNLDAFLTRE
jgi:hypothetical protein